MKFETQPKLDKKTLRYIQKWCKEQQACHHKWEKRHRKDKFYSGALEEQLMALSYEAMHNIIDEMINE